MTKSHLLLLWEEEDLESPARSEGWFKNFVPQLPLSLSFLFAFHMQNGPLSFFPLSPSFFPTESVLNVLEVDMSLERTWGLDSLDNVGKEK